MKSVITLLLMLLIVTAKFSSADEPLPGVPAPPVPATTLPPGPSGPITILPVVPTVSPPEQPKQPPKRLPPPPPKITSLPSSIIPKIPVVTITSTSTSTAPGTTETVYSVLTLNPITVTNDKVHTQFTTILSTSYSVLPGKITTITTTNDAGEPAVFSTYQPSTTIKVVQPIETPVDSADSSNPSGSSGSIYSSGDSLNVKGLRGIGMSITAVFLNMFYVLFA